MRSDLEVFDQFAKYTRNGMDGFEIEVDACEKKWICIIQKYTIHV